MRGCAARRGACAIGIGRDCAAAATFSRSAAPTLASSAETSPDGLAKKSTAPAASASNVSRAPFCVCAESITTGVGRSRMISRTASAPSRFGMLKSMVQTSGLSACTLSTASRPSLASPTISKRASAASSLRMAARMKSESSATSTRMVLLTVAPQPC